MPLVNINVRTLGDLIVREFSPADGYCREEVTVPAGDYLLGQVVVGTALTEDFAPYVAGAAIPAGSIVGIILGDHFDVREGFTLTEEALALVLHRGPAQVSDFLLKEANGLTDVQLVAVTNALATQGIDVLKAV